MKKIYISDRQKKHLKKAIAAQDQVGGKVNAGIMDAVAGCAMCEVTEKFGGKSYENANTITFITPNENGGRKTYAIKQQGVRHQQMVNALIARGIISDFNFDETKKYDDTHINPFMTGRYWVDFNTVSLYKTPITQQEAEQTRFALRQIGVDTNTIDVDFWDVKSRLKLKKEPAEGTVFVMPFKWLYDETLDDFIKMGAWNIQKRDDRLYIVSFNSGGASFFDRDGNMVTNTLKESIGMEQNTITLYHGVNLKGLEFNLENNGFIPRVCSEGGPKAIWMSERMYGYPFIFKFDMPRDQVEQLTNVDYIYTKPMSFNDFNCELAKARFTVHYPTFMIEIDLFNKELLNRQMKMIPELPNDIEKMFEKYPLIYQKYVKPVLESNCVMQEDVDTQEYQIGFEKGGFEPYGHVLNESKKIIKNDKGEKVPEKCDKCGGDVVLQIHGEPVYVCKDCGKYFGTMPFPKNLNESHEWCDNFNYKPYLKSIARFLQSKGLKLMPFPGVKLHKEEQDGLYVKTGYYDPDERKIHLFIANRHPKDVLRTFSHELVHHSQNLRGVLNGYKGDILDGDETLQKLEAEAYLKGNIYFRKWTEELRPEIPTGTVKKKVGLNESIQDIYNMQDDWDMYGVSSILSEFFSDKRNGVTKKHWDLIPAQQYQNLLTRYMENPATSRIPDNIVYDWFEKTVRNAFNVLYITELAGHADGPFPAGEVQDEFDAWLGPGKYVINDYSSGCDALDDVGFFEWSTLPDGSDGWSDFGIGPIFNELANYQPNMPAGDLLVLINRVLHIGHWRGDLTSAFIEGGSQTCSAISGIIRESIEETKWNGNGEEWKGLEPVQNPPAVLYHASPKYNRESIMELGLYPDCGEEYKDWWNYEGPNGEYPDDEELPEMVFLTDKPYTWYNNISQNGETDIYQIDVSKLDLGNLFYDPDSYQRNNGAYCYANVIPPSALKLYGQNIEENFDIEELSTPDSIDLSSFDIKDRLNPRFWKNGRIDSRVRTALLDIADDFIDYLDVPWAEPKDIIITGSLANYNWSQEHSDVDLHILYNFKDVDENVSLVKEYFDSKRRLWNDEHQNITIAGFQVELYVQDIHEPHASTGVYSLDKDEWLVRPNIKNFDLDYDKDAVKEKVAEYMNKIDDLCDEYDDSVADCDLSELHEKAEKLFDDIKNERRNGFEHGGGEYNVGNLIFKSLRRNGYIGKLSKIRTDTYDDMKSIYNENNETK